MPDDTWQQIGDVTRRMLSNFAPEHFTVPLDPELAASVKRLASREGCKPEYLIAKAVRRYMREAA